MTRSVNIETYLSAQYNYNLLSSMFGGNNTIYHDANIPNNIKNFCEIDKDYNVVLTFLKGVDGISLKDKYCKSTMFVHENLLQCKSVIEQPVKVTTPMNLYTILDIASNIEHLYGMVVLDTKTNKVFNPLHPLVALYLIKYKDLFHFEEERFTAVFYKFAQELIDNPEERNQEKFDIQREDFDELAHLMFSCFVKSLTHYALPTLGSNLSNVIKSTINGASLEKFLDDNSTFSNFLDRGIDIALFNPDLTFGKDNSIGVLVPNQIYNQGVVFPYYGISYVQNFLDNSSALSYAVGKDLTPMLSNNIDSKIFLDRSDESVWTSFDEFYVNNIQICTGSKNGRTFEGIQTLNHSNANSAFTYSILGNGWVSWVYYCINLSKQIYKEAQWIK